MACKSNESAVKARYVHGLPGGPGGPGGQYPVQGGTVAGGYVVGGGVYTTLAAARCSTQMAAVTVLNIIFSVSEKELLVPMCFERGVFIPDLRVWESLQ